MQWPNSFTAPESSRPACTWSYTATGWRAVGGVLTLHLGLATPYSSRWMCSALSALIGNDFPVLCRILLKCCTVLQTLESRFNLNPASKDSLSWMCLTQSRACLTGCSGARLLLLVLLVGIGPLLLLLPLLYCESAFTLCASLKYKQQQRQRIDPGYFSCLPVLLF